MGSERNRENELVTSVYTYVIEFVCLCFLWVVHDHVAFFFVFFSLVAATGTMFTDIFRRKFSVHY